MTLIFAYHVMILRKKPYMYYMCEKHVTHKHVNYRKLWRFYDNSERRFGTCMIDYIRLICSLINNESIFDKFCTLHNFPFFFTALTGNQIMTNKRIC